LDLLNQYGYEWLWFGLATALLTAEALFGSFRYLAASVGAVIVGGLSLLYPYVALPIQFLFFVVLSGVSIWIARSYLDDRIAKIKKLQNIVANREYVGRELKLDSAISNGYTTLNLDGVVWQVEGQDCPAGSRVKVTDMGQARLTVELIADEEQSLDAAAA